MQKIFENKDFFYVAVNGKTYESRRYVKGTYDSEHRCDKCALHDKCWECHPDVDVIIDGKHVNPCELSDIHNDNYTYSLHYVGERTPEYTDNVFIARLIDGANALEKAQNKYDAIQAEFKRNFMEKSEDDRRRFMSTGDTNFHMNSVCNFHDVTIECVGPSCCRHYSVTIEDYFRGESDYWTRYNIPESELIEFLTSNDPYAKQRADEAEVKRIAEEKKKIAQEAYEREEYERLKAKFEN